MRLVLCCFEKDAQAGVGAEVERGETACWVDGGRGLAAGCAIGNV